MTTERNAQITFEARILRKQDDLPRYIVVPGKLLGARQGRFAARVQLNDAPWFERNIHPWGRGADVFFFNVTAPQCARAKLDTGDLCVVRIEVAP